MSTKKKVVPPQKNLVLSEDEQKRVDAGGSVYADQALRLHTAWLQDFRKVLFSLGRAVAKPENLRTLGDGPKYLQAIRQRLALGLDYTLSDCENDAQFKGDPLSYDYGIDSVLSLARMVLPRHFIDGWRDKATPEDVLALRFAIDGCIIALVVRGQLQYAADLMCLVGSLMAIDCAPKGHKQGNPAGCAAELMLINC